MQLLQVHTEALCSWLLQSVHTSPAPFILYASSFWLLCEPPPKRSSLKWQVTISSTVSQCLRVITHPAVLVLSVTGDYGWGVGLEPTHGLHYLLRAGLGCKRSWGRGYAVNAPGGGARLKTQIENDGSSSPFCVQLSASEVSSPRPWACPGQERGADASPLDTVKELELYPIHCVAFFGSED